MKILLIEDEIEAAARIRRLLDDISTGHEVVIGESRDDALRLLDDDYDLLICDLRIPPEGDSMDVAEEYGFQVHTEAQSQIPGVPSVFFTGFATKANIRDSLSRGEQADLFGTGMTVPTVSQLDKDQQIELADYLRTFVSELDLLESIGLDAEGISDLNRYEARALQMYARRLGGVSLIIRPLGGLSGARTLRANVIDSDSNTRASVFCKIQPRERAIDEKRRFDDNVPNLLGLGAPSFAHATFFGIGRLGALFFSLASAERGDLFDAAAADATTAVNGVQEVRQLLTPWRNVRTNNEVTVEILRRRKTPDSLLDPWREKGHLLSQAEESQVIEVPFAIQHGDLHGRNALLLEDSRWLIIDFAEVEPAPACMDPVVLELSFLFHNESPLDRSSWPSAEQTRMFFDRDRYFDGCPCRAVLESCRDWAEADAGDVTTLATAVYCHSLRQLKYPDTDKDLAVGIASAAAEVLRTAHQVST